MSSQTLAFLTEILTLNANLQNRQKITKNNQFESQINRSNVSSRKQRQFDLTQLSNTARPEQGKHNWCINLIQTSDNQAVYLLNIYQDQTNNSQRMLAYLQRFPDWALKRQLKSHSEPQIYTNKRKLCNVPVNF